MSESKIINWANKTRLKFINFSNFCTKNNLKIIWILIISFILFFSLTNFWKYYSFEYNALDLGIFNQVFYNTSHGRLFEFTIHPHSYLGDHFEIFILFLTPFYLIFRHPLVLLFLQTIFLGLSAYLLYLITKDKISKNLSLLFVFAFLANPFIHNIDLYEFHILPFAIFFIFLTYIFYERKKYGWFILFLIISLTIREDVALVVLMLGVLAIIQKKGFKWILPPFVLGTIWFVAVMQLTGYFSGYGHYKYILYYGWLGNDYLSIINNFFAHPLGVLKHISTWHNLSFIIGIFLPFGFLPLLKPKYLIPTALVFFQIIFLTQTGEGALNIHYVALFIPFLFISLVFVFKEIFYGGRKSKIINFFYKESVYFLTIFFVVTIYCSLVMGPVIPVLKNMLNYKKTNQEIVLKNAFVNSVPRETPIAAGYDFISKLSSRKNIYSLHYEYLGKKQYSDEKYTIPNDAEYIIFNLNDFILYKHIYAKTKGGAERIRKLLSSRNFGIQEIIDNFVIWKKNTPSSRLLYTLNPTVTTINKNNVKLSESIEFLGCQGLNNNKNNELQLTDVKFNGKNYKILPLSFFWQALNETNDNYELRLNLKSNGRIVYNKIYPMAGGLYPTSEWKAGELIQTNYWFLMPDYFKKGQYQISIGLVKLKAEALLTGIRSIELKINNVKAVGQEINLGQINL